MLNLENYKKELKIIDLKKANVYALLMLIPIVLVFGLPYFLIWEPKLNMRDYLDNLEGVQKNSEI
jgi:preprotein translocase subunit YajC